ncbi:hypothetical protein KK467_29335, partial [Klebsiella pneumoniae]|uniref:hypothetical protein n=1 Tax=Klebsiella pneumoniae TaxID=573 RepID=UPI001BDFBDF6
MEREAQNCQEKAAGNASKLSNPLDAAISDMFLDGESLRSNHEKQVRQFIVPFPTCTQNIRGKKS